MIPFYYLFFIIKIRSSHFKLLAPTFIAYFFVLFANIIDPFLNSSFDFQWFLFLPMCLINITLISNKVNIWREIENANAGIVEEDTLDGTNQIFNKWAKLSSNEQIEMGKNSFKLYEEKFTAKVTSKKFVEVLENSLN
jgi:hypothetical protein